MTTTGLPNPKRQKTDKNTSNQLYDTDVEAFLFEDEDGGTDDVIDLSDEDESSSHNDLSLEPPIPSHDSPICDIPLPSSSSLSDTQDQPPTSCSDELWKTIGELKVVDYTQKVIFHGPHGGDPIDYFNFFFEEEFLQYICDQTNQQAAKQLLSEKTKKDSRINRWKDITVKDLRIFLGLMFHMGTIQQSRIQDYWKKNRLFAIPIFRQQMSRNRFYVILRCLRFSSETSTEDPLTKIRYVIDYFNKKMADSYYPARRLSLDESMALCRGQLVFGQEKKLKRPKYGVQLYTLSELFGLVVKVGIDAGNKDADVPDHRRAEKMALYLLNDLLDRGHEVYTDEYYNSVALAKQLLDKNTYCTGKLRSNLPSNPKEVMQKNLKPGENISRFCEGIHVGKWRDNHDVTYITTLCPERFVPVTNRRGEKNKPEAVARYECLSAIDRREQLLSFYPLEKHALRWYLKIAIHVFQLLMINSYKAYNKYSVKPATSLYDFRLAVIDKLLPEKPSDVRVPRNKHPVHTITKITDLDKHGRIKRKQCRQCRKHKMRMDSRWHCLACNETPGLCVECFDTYHAEL